MVIDPMAEYRIQINDIYSRIVNKYTSFASDTLMINEPIARITEEEARELAKNETSKMFERLDENYEARVAAINENAGSRGMLNSTIVLEQLAKTFAKFQQDVERMESQEVIRAKKILTENRKQILAIEKERAASKSRSIRDFATMSRMKLTVPYDTQELIDAELYNTYRAWILQLPAGDVETIVPLLRQNLGQTQYDKFLAEMRNRGLV